MLKAININGRIPGFKFDEIHILLKPFVLYKKTPTSKKFSEEEKKAICMKDSKTLDVITDDYGLKIFDHEEKGFRLSWKEIDEIRAINGINLLDTDTRKVYEEKEQKFSEFIELVFDVVLNEINNEKYEVRNGKEK